MDITDSSDEELIVDQDNGEFGPPNYVALTPDDGTAFIATGTYNHTSGYIAKAAVSVDNYLIFSPIDTVGGVPNDEMIITPDGRYLYAQMNNNGWIETVSKMDIANIENFTIISLADAFTTSHFKKRILVQDQGESWFQTAGHTADMSAWYVEDLEPLSNTEIGPKNFFEIACNFFGYGG